MKTTIYNRFYKVWNGPGGPSCPCCGVCSKSNKGSNTPKNRFHKIVSKLIKE